MISTGLGVQIRCLPHSLTRTAATAPLLPDHSDQRARTSDRAQHPRGVGWRAIEIMGGITSRSDPSHEPERALLEQGLALYGGSNPTAIEAFDVPLKSSDDNGESLLHSRVHMHTVWAKPATAHTKEMKYVKETPFKDISKDAAAACKSPMVLVHGFGSGIGIYYAALPQLANKWNAPVFAVDSLGCGLSTRPSHQISGYGKDGDVRKTEEFFVDGLEKWRESMGFDKITLVAHSLGGYISVCYAERYPERIDRLIVVGCAGVPNRPANFEENVKKRGFVTKSALSLWDAGYSPFSVARFGPGHYLMTKYVNFRFRDDPWVPRNLLTDYFYDNWAHGEISVGGYAHSTLLGPGAYARLPLYDRIPKLQLEKKLSFVYGETDWMNPKHALELQQDVTSLTSSKPGVDIEVHLIGNAGHNCMVDRPTEFVDAVLAAADDVPPRNLRFSSD